MADTLQMLIQRRDSYQGALDGLLTGKMRSGLDMTTPVGSQRASWFKPDVPTLERKIAVLNAQIARMTGDQAGMLEMLSRAVFAASATALATSAMAGARTWVSQAFDVSSQWRSSN